MGTNFTNQIRNSWPPGLLRPQTGGKGRVAGSAHGQGPGRDV